MACACLDVAFESKAVALLGQQQQQQQQQKKQQKKQQLQQ
jgi:hypothetical protein